jgi:hypothetical protein
MTDEGDRQPRSVELTNAFDRAIMAGLRLRQPDEGQRSFEVICPVCGATLMVSGKPWQPAMAARRLDAFALRHTDHDGTDHDGTDHDGTDHDGTDHDAHGGGGPDHDCPGGLDRAGPTATDPDDTAEET